MEKARCDVVPVMIQAHGAIDGGALLDFAPALARGQHQPIAVRVGLVDEPDDSESKLVAELYVTRGTPVDRLLEQFSEDVTRYMTTAWGLTPAGVTLVDAPVERLAPAEAPLGDPGTLQVAGWYCLFVFEAGDENLLPTTDR